MVASILVEWCKFRTTAVLISFITFMPHAAAVARTWYVCACRNVECCTLRLTGDEKVWRFATIELGRKA